VTRILVITNMYPPHHLGGYELTCRDAVEHWRAHGHDVGVLTTTTRVPGVQGPAGEDDGRVWRQLDWYWRDHVLQRPPLWRRFAVERANQRALASAVDAMNPDVVSVWNMGVLSLGLLTAVVERGLPAVFVVCDDWLLYAPDTDAWARLFLDRPRLARAVRAVLRVPTAVADLSDAGPFCFVSTRTRSRAEADARWRPRRATVVYSGIDPRDFPAAGSTSTYRPWAWRLLYVGRLDERKGVDTVIRALSRLPGEATLDILGRGDQRERERLQRIAVAAGVESRVTFSEVDRAALLSRYREADVVVFPSAWEEPFGLVPIEAMASATPVVATGVGGSDEFLWHERNCLRFAPGDFGALAASLERLATDDALRARIVAGGLHTAGQLTFDVTADALEAWHVWAAGGGEGPEPPARPAPVPPPDAGEIATA
jgi:glycosyltransferase involved in cell wall biosynthesis